MSEVMAQLFTFLFKYFKTSFVFVTSGLKALVLIAFHLAKRTTVPV